MKTLRRMMATLRMWYWEVFYNEDEYEHIVLERAHCSECGHYEELVNGHCIDKCVP